MDQSSTLRLQKLQDAKQSAGTVMVRTRSYLQNPESSTRGLLASLESVRHPRRPMKGGWTMLYRLAIPLGIVVATATAPSAQPTYRLQNTANFGSPGRTRAKAKPVCRGICSTTIQPPRRLLPVWQKARLILSTLLPTGPRSISVAPAARYCATLASRAATGRVRVEAWESK